jgi:SAM-dependent methyltransferase
MRSDEGRFWDERFQREGTIWGEAPSATATTVVRYVPASARLLEIGFGYGRDLAFLLRLGYRVWGVDFSAEAHRRAGDRLQRLGLRPEGLVHRSFEHHGFPDGFFDAVFSHRMAHLLVSPEGVASFAQTVARVLRPGGVLCLGVRNAADLNPDQARRVGEAVYEYTPRTGHLIRFWDDEALRGAFGTAFTFLALDRVTEQESGTFPIPCHLTILVARKIDRAEEGVERVSA